MPPPALRPPPITVKSPELNWDIGILELHDFVPDGARVIETGAQLPPVFEECIVRFNAGEQQTSFAPDKNAYLSLENVTEPKGKGLWLILKAKGSENSDPIILTDRPSQVLWAPTSDKFAVNHWADPHARDVFVVTIGTAQRAFIDLTPLLNIYFPSEGVALRRSAKAHRWTMNGDLIIRSLFQRMDEPYTVFGCEVQVGFSESVPSLTLLRGFFKD